MIRLTDQYVWNFIFSLFFIALVVMGAIILDTEAYINYRDLDTFDFVLISLATMRMIRLFVKDPITKFFREQFLDTNTVKGMIVLKKPERGPRRTLADLMMCPWCFGAWSGATITFFYLLTPYAFFPVLILAVSGVGTFLEQFAVVVGCRAEILRKETDLKR